MGDSYVTTGAVMTCTFGLAPSSLVVLPARTKMLCNVPRANIMDYAPMVNIMPFGMCNTPSNPTVASATAAAMGVLTPMPCIPAITAPWMPGNPQCLIQGQPALTRNSQCMCMWGGVVRFTTDGQMPGVPPIITPDVSVDVTIVPPLTPAEKQQLEPWQQQQYDEEMKTAQFAGSGDLDTAEDLDRMATKYEASGDTAKAAKAREASQAYRESAAKKKSEAIDKVNNKYRNGGKEPEAAPQKTYTKEELKNIQQESDKEFLKQNDKVKELDGKILENDQKADKQQKQLDQANEKVNEAATPYKEAYDEHVKAEKKRKEAEEALEKRKGYEESAKKNGASKESLAVERQLRKQAEADAAKAIAEEEAARAKMKKAETKYNNATQEREKIAGELSQTIDEGNQMVADQKEARKKRDESVCRAAAASTALKAQEKKEQHDKAVASHEEAKKDTRAKGQKAAELRTEEQGYRDNADKNFSASVDAREAGMDEYVDMYVSETVRYDQKAKAVHGDRVKAEEDYQASKATLHEAYENAYSDEARFDSYIANMDYQKSIENIDKYSE
jgi:hypothetical protein